MKQFVQHIRIQLPNETSIESFLKKAEKVSVTNEEEAYILGILLRDAVAIGKVSEFTLTKVEDAIQDSMYSTYFNQEQKPHFDDGWTMFGIIMSIIGFIGVVTGIRMILAKDFFITFHTTYLVQVIKDGGYLVILSFILFYGGFVKAKQEYKRRKLLSEK